MKKLSEKLKLLVQELQEISNELRKYNPGLKQAKIIPLSAIAHSIAGLMYKLAALRIDILNKEKEK